MICSVPSCKKPVVARALCELHYRRLRRHGDPLGGRVLNGEMQAYYRDVVLSFDGHDCLTWPYSKHTDGYARFWSGNNTQRVSRLVCNAIYGPPPTSKHEAAHACGKGHEGCVNPRHIPWKTPSENQADKLIHGTHGRGEKCPVHKLREKDVHEIRDANKNKAILQKDLAAQHGVSRQTVSDIRRGKSWSWLEPQC